ncbi:hypothetical protein JIN77_06215 [Verrucomicrobiaceae bacterium R5-34]|uniref:Transcription elongation factor GreAB n=1 Tax=Oceaniferula flava TaxID=2800421 RepID=A0AAE2SCB3_9BACT|nr:hypothetical protein [Oceaniferula flavus]MBK1830310.1 hypothetical protein [Verrucomicrobiaceae bacterium R5-34]MBK1854402.1 hypothetical protein [Oceaniferula flavus]MBM1135708.1 hypothetical protein [Oceaniferula flavus]
MKQKLVRQITARLKQQLHTMNEAAKASTEASTGDEGKAEGKYDTRALEASYLAGAQAEQSKALAHSLHVFENLELDDFSPGDPIGPGALVETELDGEISYYLLTPCAGGISIDYELGELTTLSPEAPLYQNLLERSTGDILDDSGMMILEIS